MPAKEVNQLEQESVTFVKHHAEHGPPVFFEFGEKFKRTEKLAEIFQKLQKKYWEPICDRFSARPLVLGKDFVKMTDIFESPDFSTK